MMRSVLPATSPTGKSNCAIAMRIEAMGIQPVVAIAPF
jgi:hypothetical protein